jgi:hypothetical protein
MAHIASYIVLVHDAEERLIDALELIGEAHAADAEIFHTTRTLADLSREQLAALQPLLDGYRPRRDEHAEHEPKDFFVAPIAEAREGAIGLVRDLQDLMVLTAFVNSTWAVVQQGARAMKDERLKAACELALHHNDQQARWLRTHINAAAPQALLRAP